MWLPWQIAVGLAVVLAGLSYAPQPWRIKPIAREAAIILALYALWIRAGEFEPFGVKGGLKRGLQVWNAERWLHLPSEVWLQKQILPHGWLVQASNIYYAGAHVPAAIAMLVFLFFRHRQHYRVVRTTLAGVTAISLFMHYTPVAPPRLYPQLGFIDTAIQYNQSVYGNFGAGVSTQLAAMPSLHVAWAVLVGVAVFTLEKTRWRWAAIGHMLLTIFVVTDTANHWWLDGVVGSALLVPAFLIARFIHRRQRQATPPAEPVSLLVESGQTAR